MADLTWYLDNSYTYSVTGFLSEDAVECFVATSKLQPATAIDASLHPTGVWNGSDGFDFAFAGADLSMHCPATNLNANPPVRYYLIVRLNQVYRANSKLTIKDGQELP